MIHLPHFKEHSAEHDNNEVAWNFALRDYSFVFTDLETVVSALNEEKSLGIQNLEKVIYYFKVAHDLSLEAAKLSLATPDLALTRVMPCGKKIELKTESDHLHTLHLLLTQEGNGEQTTLISDHKKNTLPKLYLKVGNRTLPCSPPGASEINTLEMEYSFGPQTKNDVYPIQNIHFRQCEQDSFYSGYGKISTAYQIKLDSSGRISTVVSTGMANNISSAHYDQYGNVVEQGKFQI